MMISPVIRPASRGREIAVSSTPALIHHSPCYLAICLAWSGLLDLRSLVAEPTDITLFWPRRENMDDHDEEISGPIGRSHGPLFAALSVLSSPG